MASHHHCHHHQQQQSHHHSTCYSDYCTCNCSPPPPQTDPLLIQALASQLLQSQQQQQHIYTQYLHKPYEQQHNQRKSQKQSHHHQDQETQRNEKSQSSLLNSLLIRIEALESSLKHTSSSPVSSLRDFAARTIQIHFRAYLVRRSTTLRNLKHLAIIKSSFVSLKSSISDKPYFNHEAVSNKAMDLLHKLDSIQGGDPMIRDGKRTICRELVQILEYIDEMAIRRKQIYLNAMKKVRFGEDNHGYKACKGGHESFVGEDVEDLGEKEPSVVSSDEQRELMDTLCKKIENIEGFTRVYEDDEEESTSSKRNHGNQSPENNLNLKTDFGSRDFFQGINGNPFYSAPMPVQMEPMRDDLMMKKEKIADDQHQEDQKL